jgi:Tfp pilus assembly protein PilF
MTASIYLAAGCREEARIEIAEGMAAASERHARGHWAAWLRLEGEMLAVDDPAGACQRLEEALALATELGMRPEGAHCHLELAKLYRRTGQRQDAQEHSRLATTMYREMGMNFWLAQAEAAMGPPGAQ